MELAAIKDIGVVAARRGGQILLEHFGKIQTVNTKTGSELVTAADIASETEIIATIRSAYPEHTILAEESGLTRGTRDYQWIIDPLDGTTNFAHQVGIFSVSIAFAVHSEIQVGVVFNPVNQELFTAVKGRGVWLNNRPIQVSEVKTVSAGLLGTGFPYDLSPVLESLTTRLVKCIQASQDVRRLGSAALDLCYVGCGRLDAFWEQHLKPWDTAAGCLIAGQAGARVTDFCNRRFQMDMPEILATNGNIHQQMLRLLKIEDQV
jgi:myo-inositol-1(or 4)-monophosphatase